MDIVPSPEHEQSRRAGQMPGWWPLLVVAILIAVIAFVMTMLHIVGHSWGIFQEGFVAVVGRYGLAVFAIIGAVVFAALGLGGIGGLIYGKEVDKDASTLPRRLGHGCAGVFLLGLAALVLWVGLILPLVDLPLLLDPPTIELLDPVATETVGDEGGSTYYIEGEDRDGVTHRFQVDRASMERLRDHPQACIGITGLPETQLVISIDWEAQSSD